MPWWAEIKGWASLVLLSFPSYFAFAFNCINLTSSALQNLHNLEKITSPEKSGFSLEHMACRFSVAQGTVNKLSIPTTLWREAAHAQPAAWRWPSLLCSQDWERLGLTPWPEVMSLWAWLSSPNWVISNSPKTQIVNKTVYHNAVVRGYSSFRYTSSSLKFLTCKFGVLVLTSQPRC